MATKKKTSPLAEQFSCNDCGKPYTENDRRSLSAEENGRCDKCHAKSIKKLAASALVGVKAYAKLVGLSRSGDGLETVLSDMLADLGHLCDQKGIELGDCLRRGRDHYNAGTETPKVQEFSPLD